MCGNLIYVKGFGVPNPYDMGRIETKNVQKNYFVGVYPWVDAVPQEKAPRRVLNDHWSTPCGFAVRRELWIVRRFQVLGISYLA